MIYMIVVPLLLFFFLKDKDAIFAYISKSLPSNRSLMTGVWEEMNEQFANYLRGKVVEIMVVGIATYAIFALFGLNYALLLAIIVGLSVVIPYIGAVVVTIPVTLIAMFQFGFEASFYYVVGGYLLIQILDGNVLVPLLFSEVVNLHPSVIIMAVIFFGGVWGLWGIFFAIPLATLFKAVLHAWPTREQA
jgi:putative permease